MRLEAADLFDGRFDRQVGSLQEQLARKQRPIERPRAQGPFAHAADDGRSGPTLVTGRRPTPSAQTGPLAARVILIEPSDGLSGHLKVPARRVGSLIPMSETRDVDTEGTPR